MRDSYPVSEDILALNLAFARRSASKIKRKRENFKLMFLFKKIVAPFFFPMPLCLGISFLGLFFLWFTAKQRMGRILVSVGICSLFLLSSGLVPYAILSPLEKQYPPRLPPASAKFVVVLGGGGVFGGPLPITSQLNPFSLTRLLEGIRIHREIPNSRLIFTGKGPSEAMAKVAEGVGVNKAAIIIETESRDTKDEARNVRQIVRTEPFILVTSASHMPRTMALFQKQGLNPVPFASGHLLRGSPRLTPDILLPAAFNLFVSERAVYEYLGLMWAKLRGQV